ncbi:MAG TPA: hypothetical protein VGZ47_09800 [Gemmataceae bacterium]|jgi:hypothetical protein|nr:hypothetical protein [Gemmataceae bacterium]
MSTITTTSVRAAVPVRGIVLAGGMLALAAGAAFLAGWTPILFSIVTVFLFAGPHNWLEARYFLTRLPRRWGKLRGFFLFAFAGVFALTATFAALPGLAKSLRWGPEGWHSAMAGWNTLVLAWITSLIIWRSRQNPRRDWGLAVPVAFLIVAVNWLFPYHVGLALVFLHPLMALWLLDRELRRSRPAWRPAYHVCLLALPLLLALLWWKLYNAPPLPGDTDLREAITQHAGADVLHGISSHLLVATHTFLEMVHYGVWVLAMPLIGLRIAPWKLANVPMARRSAAWRLATAGLLLLGLAIMIVLWAFFLADYPTTRHVYFTVALMHVLAEVPFLLRAL